jgi:uncharacterized membrane protein (DUF4010 family)
MEILQHIPVNLINFVLVTVLSLLIGLEQSRILHVQEDRKLFGTDRTFTFIGILGFVLYIIQPETLYLYMGGGLVLAVMLGLYYHNKLKNLNKYGMTTIMIALLTYCIAPLIITQPKWLAILIIVTVLIFTEMKERFSVLSKKFDSDEFITLGKFLVIAGVILPVVPNQPIVSFLNLTPYKIWLAVVVISSISYISYLLKKFIFKDAGIIISGILGGLYSSTATTFIIARKSKEANANEYKYAAAIIFATLMMYIRICIIMFIFNPELGFKLLPAFLVLIAVSAGVGLGVYFIKRKPAEAEIPATTEDKNPLEFKVAIIFTLLFIVFTIVTYYTITYFGVNGLNVLSFIVGMTDIDPFLINLFQGGFNVSIDVIAIATLQAIISNNILKTIYAVVLSNKKIIKPLVIGFSIIIITNIVFAIII